MPATATTAREEEPMITVVNEPSHIAEPPAGCLNGCHTGHGPERQPREPEPGARICTSCIKRLTGWLRTIPESYHWLPLVLEHGTVTANPESSAVKAPDAPAPMRLEIVDLLDYRRGYQHDAHGVLVAGDNRRGAFGILLAWAGRIRLERDLPRSCDCGHTGMLHCWAPPLASLCRANCGCTGWQVKATVAGECAFITQHLAWVTEQEWTAELYAELKPLARQLSDAVGEFRPAAVGMCVALVPPPASSELDTEVLCGGALYRDSDGMGVHCASCGDKTRLETLRRLGREVGLLSDNHEDHLEAS